jgi:hypothetical protein
MYSRPPVLWKVLGQEDKSIAIALSMQSLVRVVHLQEIEPHTHHQKAQSCLQT